VTERQLKLRISQLSDEDLFKMVNEDIVDHGKAEITLAYDELERRGLLPTPVAQPSSTITGIGCLVGLILLAVEVVLIDHTLFIEKQLLSLPRALALVLFISLVARYRERKKFGASFLKHLLWSACLVLLASLALWDLPNLLRQRIPVAPAFGIPAALFAAFLFWIYKFYPQKVRQKDSSETEE
jgi:hypothetical protein